MTIKAKAMGASGRHFFAVALAMIAVGFAATVGGSANAQYTLCNKTSYALSAAVGYGDGGAVLTRGWWRIRPGQCKRVLSDPITAGRYFVYAEAIAGHVGDLRTWSGQVPLCVQNDSLFTLRDQDECGTDPRRQREFFAIDIADVGDGTYTTEFTDERNFSTFDAEVAGVQRLLQDVGVYSGKIDGELGNATRSAVTRFQASKGLPRSGAISDDLIDALMDEAGRLEEARGFEMCNSTMLPVWAAFAQPMDGADTYTSSGWWRLEGQECAKVRRGEMGAGPYYVYGIMEAESRSMPLAGGDQPFCIADVQFEAGKDVACDDEGYEEANFRRVDPDGQASVRFEFTPELFNPDLAGR